MIAFLLKSWYQDIILYLYHLLIIREYHMDHFQVTSDSWILYLGLVMRLNIPHSKSWLGNKTQTPNGMWFGH
jgi:hypothetical protein